LINVYVIHVACAVAVGCILRALFAAFLSLAGRPLYDLLGLGWGNSPLVLISIAFISALVFLIVYDERMWKSKILYQGPQR